MKGSLAGGNRVSENSFRRCEPQPPCSRGKTSPQQLSLSHSPSIFLNLPDHFLFEAHEGTPQAVFDVLRGTRDALLENQPIVVGAVLAPTVAGVLLGYPVVYFLNDKGQTTHNDRPVHRGLFISPNNVTVADLAR